MIDLSLARSVSTIAVALALGVTASAQAQTTGSPAQTTPSTSVSDAPGAAPGRTDAGAAAGDEDAIIVTGVRASLKTAQAIKRNAVQVVDSIAAEDIGKLPDNTVSDALQRVTGIQVQRSNGEASSVQLRGLPDVESLINGRETFTGTGRGVALADIPAELVAGVDVYKTDTPDQIEGAVAGLIDIRLRRPFDFQGFQLAGSVRGIYGEQRDKWSYIGSGLISNRWTTKSGQEFGVLIGASYNHRSYEDQTAFNFGFNPLTSPATGNVPLLIPDTVGGLVTDGDRTRPSLNVALQWKPTPDLEFYADGLFTGYRNDYDVDFFVGLPKAGNVSATTAQPGSNVPGVAIGTNPPALIASGITTLDNFTISSKQTFHQKTDGYQGNIGARWHTGKATLSTEVTYNKSEVSSQQLVLDTSFFVKRIDYTFNTNKTPSLNFNGYDITSPVALNLFALFDNRNVATSDQIVWRGDLAYDNSENHNFFRNFKVGARVAHRTGESAGTNGDRFGLGSFPGLPGAGFPNFSTNAPGGIIDGRLGVDRFALADSGFIRKNIVQLRGLAGIPAEGRAFDPNIVFSLKEDVYAAYGQLGFGFSVGTIPIEGVVGARLVNTVTKLNAIQVTTFPADPPESKPPPPRVEPITGNSNDLDVLPSITLKIRLIDKVVVRLIAGKSIFRPQFAQLDPATSLTQLGITGGTSAGSGAGGNANLRPVKSDNYDASIEWYFSSTGSITVGGFYKNLKGYIQAYSALETFPGSNGQPQQFLVARPRNGGDGVLKGVEVGYQQFFDFLPGPLSGFGAQANFTLSDGQVDSAPVPGQASVKQDIILTSKYSYNVVAIYDKYGISGRLAYNWRSKYTDSYSVVPGGRVVADAIAFLDLSLSYGITDAITLTFDATNLLDATYHDSFGTSGFTPRDTRQYDRTFGGGVRFRF